MWVHTNDDDDNDDDGNIHTESGYKRTGTVTSAKPSVAKTRQMRRNNTPGAASFSKWRVVISRSAGTSASLSRHSLSQHACSPEPTISWWVRFVCFIVILCHNNCISIISWWWYDAGDEEEPALLPTQRTFSPPHHIGMAREELAFDDAVSYTQQGNG